MIDIIQDNRKQTLITKKHTDKIAKSIQEVKKDLQALIKEMS